MHNPAMLAGSGFSFYPTAGTYDSMIYEGKSNFVQISSVGSINFAQPFVSFSYADIYHQYITVINKFLKSGGGVAIFGSENSKSQNKLLKTFGAEFTAPASHPLKASDKITQTEIEGEGGSVLGFENDKKWDILMSDAADKAVMARKKIGKGTLLVSSRSLSGSHPSSRDSINKDIWKPLLIETASGKEIDPNKEFNSLSYGDLEYNDDHGTFKLSYNDYLKPSADAMVDVYKRSMPFVEKRMGVPLSPGMASQVTLLATGGGGFSSGTVGSI